MVMNKPKRVSLPKATCEVPPDLCSEDFMTAAGWLREIAGQESTSMSNLDVEVCEEIATWLVSVAKAVQPLDAQQWDTARAIREERQRRNVDQFIASHYGVGEATIRSASPERRTASPRKR